MRSTVYWIAGVTLMVALGSISIAFAKQKDNGTKDTPIATSVAPAVAQAAATAVNPATVVSKQALLTCDENGCVAQVAMSAEGVPAWVEGYAVYPTIAKGLLDSGCVFDDSKRPKELPQPMRACPKKE